MDTQKFLNAQFSPREADVEVPELADFFDDKSPVWRVRGLSAIEVGRAGEKAQEDHQQNIRDLIDAFSGGGDKAEAVQNLLGIAEGQVPRDVSARIEELTIGSVEPAIGMQGRDVVVRLARTHANTFYRLTQKIRELTDAGAELGKLKRSGSKKKSGE